MEQLSTRRFFSSDFVIKNKLSFSTVIILQDIYFWLLSENNSPKRLILNNKTFYFISQSHFTRLNYGLLSQPAVSQIFKELKNIGIIESSFIKDEKENYINFNWDKIKESLLPDEELQNMEDNPWWKRIHAYADEQIRQEQAGKIETIYDTDYEIVRKGNRDCLVRKQNKESSINDSMLLTENDMEIKTKYCQEADAIARLILKRYNCYFNHKVPEEGVKPTNTYVNLCNKMTDIYNGTFIKSRFYPLSEKFLNNSQFNIEGWKDKIKEVQGDWLKVKKLILNSMRNFMLMHDENRMPYSKEYLQNRFESFLYDNQV